MTTFHRTCIWLLILSVGVLAACSDNESSSKPPAPALAPITFALDLWPGYYPAIIAHENGYFSDRGIEVAIKLPGNTDRMLADFTAGNHDIIAVALGDIINLANHAPVQVILVADESAGGDAVLTQTPTADLRGKRIGTNLGGFGELLITEMLNRQGIQTSEVQLVNIDAADAPKLLADQLLDYAHTWEPYVSEAINTGATVVFDSSDTPGLIPDVVAVNQHFADQNPDSVKAFVAAWLDAQAWWLDHFDEGNALIAEFTGLPADSINLTGIELKSAQQNHQLFSEITETSLQTITEKYIQFYLKKGTLPREIESHSLLSSAYLP